MTTRRDFLTVLSASSAALVVGVRLPARRSGTARAFAGDGELNAWITISSDDQVTLTVNESEMGQGVLTSLPMILAEELDVDWTRVRSRLAGADTRFGNQSTGGSTSVRMDYDTLRKAGAAARQMLIAAAAAGWSVPATECGTEPGVVVHQSSGRRASYGNLAARAATLAPPADPPLKDPKTFRFIGKPTKRLDTSPKVTGRAVFGIDVQRPGLLTALVAHCPVFGGKVAHFDATAALKVPGVRRVVEIPTGVAVVADNFWAAKKGRDALQVGWDEGAGAALSSQSIAAKLRELAPTGATANSRGDANAALGASGVTRIDAEYELPYLAHAPMEPLNCTADVRADSCEIWVPTQAQTSTRRVAAEITGLAPEKVTVHTTFLGGGFGRRSQTDFVADAVHASKAVGKPVKVVYTRDDDLHAGWYRPVSYNAMSAALDSDGWPTAWVHRIASPSILASMGPLRNGIDGSSVEGAQNLPYAIPNFLCTWAKADFGIPVWFWRSVGSSLNGYVTECFIDELAHAGKKDPVELRRRLLTDHPRHRRVLDLAAEKAGWGSPLPAGRARGVAVHECFGSIVAEVAEVSLGEGGLPRVHRVVVAVDCGQYVNPDTIVAQMESGIAYGLTAALWGEITIAQGRAVQNNFDSYRVLRIDEMPVVETHIVAEGDAMGGIGEPGTPPIAPAVANALLVLTGKPVRRLPIMQQA